MTGLADTPVAVEVVDVTDTDGGATATLAWTWELPGVSWEYTTKAELAEAAGRWEVDWEPNMVTPDLVEGQHLALERVTAERGDILGAGGVPLVTERSVIRFGRRHSSSPFAGPSRTRIPSRTSCATR